MHHSQGVTRRKVGKEQTNPDCSLGDLCFIPLQSISRRALGKGSCAIALVWVLLTWSSDTSENVCQQGLYRRCNFLAARAAKNKVPPRPLAHPNPKRTQVCHYCCQNKKRHSSTASSRAQLTAEGGDFRAPVCGPAPHVTEPGWM